METATDYAFDYIDKFYPEVDLANGQLEQFKETGIASRKNLYLPAVTYAPAHYQVHFGNVEQGTQLLEAILAMTCSSPFGTFNPGISQEDCLNYQQNAQELYDSIKP